MVRNDPAFRAVHRLLLEHIGLNANPLVRPIQKDVKNFVHSSKGGVVCGSAVDAWNYAENAALVRMGPKGAPFGGRRSYRM